MNKTPSSAARHWNPTIRVGMPLPSGELLDYGVASGLPMLMSANAFSRVNAQREFVGFNLRAAKAIPAHVDCALDSAGFVAASVIGDYRWSVDAYLDLAEAREWTFYSAMDYCVERQVAPDAATRRLRVDATVARYFQCANRAVQRGLQLPLAVIQGFFASEYAYCVEALALGKDTKMVGIGSVCRRHLHGPDGLIAIVEALDRVLPPETVCHLFGAKGSALPALEHAGLAHRVGSTDSMAYDMAVRRATPVGRTQIMRARAMVDWHARETRRLREGTARPSVLPCAAGERRKDPLEVATQAVGAAFGELHGSNDIDYLDAKHLVKHDVYVVTALLRTHGVEAFVDEEPEDDFGLGVVYQRVREALVGAGYLAVTA